MLIDHLDSRLDDVRQFGSNIILAGDFNVHIATWLRSTKTIPAGEALEDVYTAHHLAQHVTDSTRGNNTLDLVISDFDGPVATAIHPQIGHSDHAVVTACFSSADPHINHPTTRKASPILVQIGDDSAISLALRTGQPSSMTIQITLVSKPHSISSRVWKSSSRPRF